ncbi:MAG: Rho-binding antiterminator [Gammaproteobacteria bacterium]|nr:Rho-binding antiterminator [Gammaproteobacteria bacterium]MBU1490403.1 Rho-binding antiterminator [Gammaproteobacteria bacterium]MBU2140354.1 Rho-binding antiterminator [Gammaproteobacteria bacterium]MBU2217091.1 Rho-binding antiterminator [Gammaproteobacteria bacterium]MBU2321861.1 Rho-binding antiterminator [Gammaproteobacteria bacterium]
MNAEPPYQPLDCRHYDALELACLRGDRLHVELRDGRVLEGRAAGLQTESDKAEYLRLQTDSGEQRIRLDQLQAITAQDPQVFAGRMVFD